jgi:hypothetical protein
MLGHGCEGQDLVAKDLGERNMKRFLDWLAWALAAWIAFVFVWYLQFKFTGDDGSVGLFTTLTDWLGLHGHEKAMRIGTGSAELIASIIIFDLPLQSLGALLAFGIMSGAIFFHLVSPLGIDPYGDGGVLFKQAVSVWLSSIVIMLIRYRTGIALIQTYLPFVPVPARLRSL